MQLKSVTLRNIGLHEYVHVDFQPGLVGIFGPQGSGKTTIMNAIYAALTNDFSRLWDTKDGVVRQQAQPHEVSSIVLDASHSGTAFRLERMLSPRAKSKFELEGQSAITADAKIRVALSEVLGANRALLDNYVFVNQNKVTDLFQQTDSIRAETLSDLCGTRFMADKHKSVNRARETDLQLLNLGVEDVDRLRRELGESAQKLKETVSNIDQLCRKALDAGKLAEIREAREAFREWQKLAALLPVLQQAVPQKFALAKTAVKESKRLESEVEILAVKLEQAAAAREQADSEKALYDSQKKLWEQKATAATRLVTIEKALMLSPPTYTIGQTSAALRAEIKSLEEAKAPAEQLLRQFEKFRDATVCPTCKQSLASIQQTVKEARESLVPLQGQLANLEATLMQRENEEEEIADFQRNAQKLQEERTTVAASLESMAAVFAPLIPDLELLTKLRATEVVIKTQLAATRRNLSTANTTRDTAVAAHQSAKAEVANVEAQLKAAAAEVCSEQEYTQLGKQLEADVTNSKEQAAAEALRAEFAQQVAAKQKAIESAEKIRAQSEQARRWVDILSRAAVVLHRDCLPYKVHHRALSRLEHRVNATLAEFEGTFRVKTAEDLGYMCNFFNGTHAPDRRLSGGQQVVLALSFRWALNSQFAKQIGMLVLDEPTANLDTRHLSLLESTLTRLGAAAKSRGYQVFVITHEESLRGVFDQVVDLGRAIA